MKAKIIDHVILLVCSAVYHGEIFSGKAFGQLLILKTFPVAPTAVPDDQVDIVRRDVSATDIAVVIALTVKRANYVVGHGSLICKNRWGFLCTR